jgi:ankyrin repeat protein
LASSYGYKEIVEVLVNNGALVNQKGEDDNTALVWACQNGYKEIAEVLVYSGADVKAKNNDGTQGTVYFPDDKDDERSKNASNFTKRVHSNSDNGFFDKLEKMGTYDAVNRNMRRHPERWDGDKPVKPKTESTIFDNIEII